MADIYDRKKRSEIMARVRATGTKPEKIVRQVAFSLGLRYRLHRDEFPGRPDLVFPRHRKVIFVHGCFWHGHIHCRKARRPEANRVFWDQKLSRNIERDQQNTDALKAAGWGVLAIWECQARNRNQVAEMLREFFGENLVDER